MKLPKTRISAIVVAAGLVAPAWAALTIVDTEPGTFIDISGIGEILPLSGDLSVSRTTTISNAVFPAGEWWVGNNGGIGVPTLPSSFLAPMNAPLPSTDAFGGGKCMLGYWDDIGNTVGHVYWAQLPDRLVVEWANRQFEDSTDTLTFEMQIFDNPSNSIYAQVLFSDIEQPRADGGKSSTIGYQKAGTPLDNVQERDNDVQWSYNTAGAVANGTVLSLMPEPASAALLLLGVLLSRRLC